MLDITKFMQKYCIENMTEEEQQRYFIACLSGQRMNRYLRACRGNKAQAIALYRMNLRLGVECFCLISYFEIVLRNAINRLYVQEHGPNWLKNATVENGIYSDVSCKQTRQIIQTVLGKLEDPSHADVVAALDLGFWRYQFAGTQFHAAGQKLLQIFPNKPKSGKTQQYNHTYVFRQLGIVNDMRNRIAHHEPLCFAQGTATIDLSSVKQCIAIIDELMEWLDIDQGIIFNDCNDRCESVIQEIEDFGRGKE